MSRDTTLAMKEAVHKLYEQEGVAKPQKLVDMARDPLSPIHDCFEWNDQIAGEKFRIIQARQYIRNITVIIVEEEVEVKNPKYVHDPAMGKESGYVRVDDLKADDNAFVRHAAILAELRFAKAALRRAHNLTIALSADFNYKPILLEVVTIMKIVEQLKDELH